MFYLLANANPFATQFRTIRRNGASPSGVIVAHSAENTPDWILPDTGAENVARWIATIRQDYGSYHAISDSDSGIAMAPFDYETWHDRITNNHSIGCAVAMRAALWHSVPQDFAVRMIKGLAVRMASAAEWVEDTHGITVPTRFVTGQEARDRVPGYTLHGWTDSTRRSDPWANHPMKDALNEFLIDSITAYRAGVSGPDQIGDDWTYDVVPKARNYAKRTYPKGEVARIQGILKGAGFYNGHIDDFYGFYTYNAVKGWQDSQIYWPGKYVDGDWGPVSWKHYHWTTGLQATMRPLNPVAPHLLRIDGDYGPVTHTAVFNIMIHRPDLYRGIVDNVPGPIFCKGIGFRPHPGLE